MWENRLEHNDCIVLNSRVSSGLTAAGLTASMRDLIRMFSRIQGVKK